MATYRGTCDKCSRMSTLYPWKDNLLACRLCNDCLLKEEIKMNTTAIEKHPYRDISVAVQPPPNPKFGLIHVKPEAIPHKCSPPGTKGLPGTNSMIADTDKLCARHIIVNGGWWRFFWRNKVELIRIGSMWRCSSCGSVYMLKVWLESRNQGCEWKLATIQNWIEAGGEE
jgi:hypothetical protein